MTTPGESVDRRVAPDGIRETVAPRDPRARAWTTDDYVHRWQVGDDAAFEALYARFAPLLARRVLRHPSWALLRRRGQVEDVVQSIWQRAIPAARTVFTPSGPGSFHAFLGTLADRAMVDLARHQGAAKRGDGAAEDDFGTPPLARNGESPSSHARASEILELARGLLNARELEVWELVELEGYELEEVALALGSTASAARGVYFRARRKLVQAVGEESADR